MPHHRLRHLQGKRRNYFLEQKSHFFYFSWKIQNLCRNRWTWTSSSTMRLRLGQSRSLTWERLPSASSCPLAPTALCPLLLSLTKKESSSSESSLSTWTTWSKRSKHRKYQLFWCDISCFQGEWRRSWTGRNRHKGKCIYIDNYYIAVISNFQCNCSTSYWNLNYLNLVMVLLL